MNYFTQSLNFPLSYERSQQILDTIGMYSFEEVLQEGLGVKERRDLNKIYEQTDIFVKRNSIVTINNKKQKRYFASSLALQRAQFKHTQTNFDSPIPLLMTPKQGALYQQIHPSDVQKTADDNIFDYRLHMKLARSQQIFKVEQVKRKQKKKQLSSAINIKECECCGREYSRYHKCNHSLCDRRCKKVKKGESRRDVSSVVYSDSKDENWSQQNFQQQRVRQRSEKKSQRAQNQPHPSSSSNRTNRDPTCQQPSQRLLLSVDKLLTERAFNSFSYKFIQIRQDQQQIQPSQSSIVINNIDEFKQLQGGSGMNDDDNRSNQQLMYHHQQQNFHELSSPEEKQQFCYGQVENKKNFGNGYEKKTGRKIVQQKRKVGQEVSLQIKNGKENNLVQQKQNLQDVEGQGVQGNNQSQNQQQQQNSNIEQSPSPTTPLNAINIKNPVNNINQLMQSGSSSSSSQQILQQRMQDFPEQPKISLDEEDKDDLMLEDKEQKQQQKQKIKQEDQSINQKQKQVQEILKQDTAKKQKQASLPDYRPEEDSLNEQIDEIQQQQVEETQPKPISKLLTQPVTKLTKKQSKQLKMMEKERVMSEQIEEIEPTVEMQKQDGIGQDGEVKENVKDLQSKIQTEERHGRGKGQGMGHGYGIFQQELDIYSESSSLLQAKPNDNQNENELFQKLQQNPKQSKSNNYLLPQSLSSKSLPSFQPGTPRKRVVVMEKIIQQIKLQSQKVEEEKGLGRGKVFGRGMGVVQWGEELERQIENGDIMVYGVNDDDLQQQSNGRKIIKQNQNIANAGNENIIFQQQQQASSNSSVPNPNPSSVDKFDQLIIDQSQQSSSKRQHPQVNDQNQIIQNQCEQAMNYIEYLNKRETLVHPRECVGQFVEEEEDISGDNSEGCEDGMGMEKEREDWGNVGNSGDNLQGENSISNQINQQDLQQMIDLQNQSQHHSMSQKQEVNSPPQYSQ